MSRKAWHHVPQSGRHGREATMAQIIETIDWAAPETKAELATEIGISEQYLSELLQALKRDGVVKKGYVVDEDELYANVEEISQLASEGDAAPDLQSQRSQEILSMLERLEEVTRSQYQAAWTVFDGASAEEPAEQLEPLSNERHTAVFSELKSYTLATEWPGNRVASDLATIATNLEIVGDRACFVADVVDNQETTAAGVVEESVDEIFAAGERINGHMREVLFDASLDRYEELRAEEDTLHRDLNELFELVTAYDPDMYGYLVTVTRALERAIFYWVHTAELAVRLHSGRQPEHIGVSASHL